VAFRPLCCAYLVNPEAANRYSHKQNMPNDVIQLCDEGHSAARVFMQVANCVRRIGTLADHASVEVRSGLEATRSMRRRGGLAMGDKMQTFSTFEELILRVCEECQEK
jgi:hypothetical protein